jgi:hypothetical protein
MKALSPPERDAFMREPHVGVLSVASDDDRPPLTVPVWYAYDGLITFFTGTDGRKARKTRLIEHAGALSFCVQKADFPYRYATAECTVVDVERTPSVDKVVAITERYLPADAARAMAEAQLSHPAGTFVLFTARPDRWSSMDVDDGEIEQENDARNDTYG